MNLIDNKLWLSHIFQHLRAENQIETGISEGELLSLRDDVHKRSRAQINSYIPVTSIPQQTAIRLNTATHIKHAEILLR
jgi:hypothetical protein